MKGNVIWDSISALDFYMTNGSTLEGAFVNDETYAGNGGDGYCNVVIDKDSTWTVTGDSDYTITVDFYQDSADASNATAIDDWSNYEVERPENL